MELLLGILAEAIFSRLIEDLAQRPQLAALRKKLNGPSPEQLALQRALAATYASFSCQYPHLANSLFDEDFLLKPKTVAELTRQLIPGQSPDKMVIERAWGIQFRYKPDVNLRRPMTYFLAIFEKEIKAQPDLKPFVDNRAFNKLYIIAENIEKQTASPVQTNDILDQIRNLIGQGNQYLKRFLDGQAVPPPTPQPSTPPSCLESLEGTMHPDSSFYIERPEDQIAKDEITGQGATLTITGPRYAGKSSMLTRLAVTAKQHGKSVVILDCRTFGNHVLENADLLFRQFCILLTEELGFDINQVDMHWHQVLSGPRNCERYLKRYLFKQLGGPLLIALEAVDALFEAPKTIRNDLFRLLRSWSEQRRSDPQSIFREVGLILVISTEVYQLIEDPTISPFNTGRRLGLSDFSKAQVQELNHRYGEPLTKEQAIELQELVGGHPHLTQLALYWAVNNKDLTGQLFTSPFDVTGPFETHLKRLLKRLCNHPEQQTALQQVFHKHKLDDHALLIRLEGAGLVHRGTKLKEVLPRCNLYQEYFTAMLFQ